MKVAIHQNNFVPWMPFFYKMAMADKFVILNNVQFEKNNYQNRFLIHEYHNQFEYRKKWVTKPIKNDSMLTKIKDKKYLSGASLNDLNMKWIYAIKETLDIDTEICFASFDGVCSPTQRLINEVKAVGGDVYVTNPEAKDKYLDEDLMRSSGIDIEYCKVPKHLNIHTFEAFEKFGIEGTIKQLPLRVKDESQRYSIK